eukprot:COSAG01_NODE_334_length_18708_cov_49.649686_19_plen_113_part_00
MCQVGAWSQWMNRATTLIRCLVSQIQRNDWMDGPLTALFPFGVRFNSLQPTTCLTDFLGSHERGQNLSQPLVSSCSALNRSPVLCTAWPELYTLQVQQRIDSATTITSIEQR